MERDALVRYLDQQLQVSRFRDYCPNGLQVEGKARIRRVITGVTACQALLDAAVTAGADLLLVHHGYFWKGENPTLVGMRRRRLATLLRHEINLLAYHLPLDCHPLWGNNAQLGLRLGVAVSAPESYDQLLWQGELAQAVTLAELGARLASALERQPLLCDGGHGRPVRRLAWCTGAAQDEIEQAALTGADCFISGEISERTVHQARELGIHYIAAGHHATERYGVQALGQHLSDQFGLEVQFIDIDNPV